MASTVLNWREQLFFRYCCKDPAPFHARRAEGIEPDPLPSDPLDRMRRVFSEEFERSVQGRVVVDFGCGTGDQVLGVAMAGARKVIGIDLKREYRAVGETRAQELQLGARVSFTQSSGDVADGSADVVFSQNSFEHFRDPAGILREAARMLRPGGVCFVTFGPPWWHPFGEHFYFMIRPDRPWMHALFSERTILRVRQLYLPNAPLTYGECGLNQMTIRKFRQIIVESPLNVTMMSLTKSHWAPKLLSALLPEITTAHVSAILTRP